MTRQRDIDNDMFRRVLDEYLEYFSLDTNELATGEVGVSFKIWSPDKIRIICKKAESVFRDEPIVLHIESPITVVGDLHGHIVDLFRVLKNHKLPNKTKYLFLGDLVDRGEFSLETVLLIFILKILWPQNCYLVRGNHEFHSICYSSGFFSEIDANYVEKDTVYNCFITAFNQIPLAAIIDKRMLAIHGGIGPSFQKISQLEQLERPILDFGNPILDEALWSDPNQQVSEYEKSHRGTGFLYGVSAFNRFMDNNGIDLLIRGHECVSKGYEYRYNNRLITVFSASNYCSRYGNDSAVLTIEASGNLKVVTYPPLCYLKRSSAMFFKEGFQGSPSDAIIPKSLSVSSPNLNVYRNSRK